MLDILLLVIIACLIYRIIDHLFDNLERLFTSKKQQLPVTISPPKVEKKDILKKQEQNPVPKEQKIVDMPQQKDVPHKSSNDILSKVSKKKIEPPSKIIGVEKDVKDNQINNREGQAMNTNEQVARLRQQIQDQKQLISELNKKIELHNQQKKNYVSRIEQIIQHVTKQQQQQVSNNIQGENQDEQIKVIQNLKIQLNNAHLLQLQKINAREQELRLAFAQQKQQLIAQYDCQIRQLRQKLSGQCVNDGLAYVMNIHSIEDNDNLHDTIEQLQKDLQIVKLQKQSLQEQLIKITSFSGEKTTQGATNFKNQNSSLIIRQNQYLKSEVQRLTKMALNLQNQIINLRSQYQNIKLSHNSNNLNQQRYLLIENDQIQKQNKYLIQIESLKLQKQSLEQKVIEVNQILYKVQEQLKEVQQFRIKRMEEQILSLQINLQKERQDGTSSYKKLTQAQSQLQFVQMQLNQAIQTEKELRQEIQKIKNSAKKAQNASISQQKIKIHPEYLKIQQKINDLQSQNKRSQAASSQYKPTGNLSQTGKDFSHTQKRANYSRVINQRQVSPSFQVSPKQTNNDHNFNKLQTASSKNRMTSTIFSGVGYLDKMNSPIDLRYKTPLNPKSVAQSSINEGGLVGESYFGETCILSEPKKLYLIEQINKLKKISAKKTRLLYRSLNKYNKPLSEYISNVPNILIVIQLNTKKIIAAFSQAAFSKEINNNNFAQKKYVSINKTMILDVSEEKIYLNNVGTDTIRYDQKTVIWGRNQLIISNEEPASLTCNLNCQGAIYQTDISSQILLNSSTNTAQISQFEVYRIFLG